MSRAPQLRSIKAVIVGGLVVFTTAASAQLSVDPQTDLQALAQSIAGEGVRIANPVIDCHGEGYGEFTYSGNLLDVSEGVILTSGRIVNAIGPNNVSNKSFQQNNPGDALLDAVSGRTTHDACRLEFDVIPGGDSLSFDFVFASEEYNEWVGSQFNDVFGFFISGPGIAGDAGIGTDHNIALVPGTAQPVTINNVNAGSNSAYFQFNAGGSEVQYDGITRDLRAIAVVQPCETYHLKLIVADASDGFLDSGVLIARIVSNAVTMTAFTATGMANMVEGCNEGTVRFTRSNVTALPQNVDYFIAGSAINGIDYPLLGTDPDPLVAKTATIPANMFSVDVLIDPLDDGTTEGTEEVRFYLGASACPNNYLDSLVLGIQDSLYATVNTPAPICTGGQAQLNASGGLTYSWSPSTELNNAGIANPIADPTITTNYTVTVSAGSCIAEVGTTLAVTSLLLSADITPPLCTGASNGILNLTVSGGLPPYSFNWTGPNGFTAATEDLINISSGIYTVTATDGASCAHVQSFNVSQPQALTITLSPSVLAFGQNIACFDGSTGSIALNITGGVGPYGIDWTGPNGYTSTFEDINDLITGNYTVIVTDANGCAVNDAFTMTQPDALLAGIAGLQQVSCFGADDGAATATISGGMPAYSFEWNTVPVQNTATASALVAGSYTVTITDGYGCTTTQILNIVEPDQLAVAITGVSHILSCQGQAEQDGSATASVSGGTAPYEFSWNTAPVQNIATVTFNTGGTYTASISDANGCSAVADVTIDQAGTASIAIASQMNTVCFGDDIGSAIIEVIGGAPVQSIAWNTLPVQTGTSVTGLAAGTYTATVQHADGCSSSIDVIIDGPTSALIASIDPSIVNVQCAGIDNGSATVIASGGGSPYSYSWNTAPEQTSATATDLGIGTWTAIVSDAFGCSAQANAMITGPAQPLTAVISSFINALCSGAAQGQATADASGGSGPYTYLWNTPMQQTGATAEDLPQGTYTVIATDASGCTTSTSVTILGPNDEVEAIVEDYGNVSCFGYSDGFATILASGGSNSFTIVWNTVPPQFGPTATGLEVGTYLVEITDNNGCDSTKYLAVGVSGPPSPLVMDLAITTIGCVGVEDGAADVTMSGGQAPYTYQWSDNFGNSTGIEDVTGLGAGDYFLHAFDAFGCAADTSFSLTQPEPITLQAIVNAVPCQGSSTGSIDALVDGGTGTLGISWTGPNSFTANTASIANLEAGDYFITLSDDNACTVIDTFAVIVSEPPVLSAIASNYNGTPISCAGASNGAIDLTISGGLAPYTIAWTDGIGFYSSNEDLDSLNAGGYQVTVTDSLGCVADTLVLLLPPQPISIAPVISSVNGNNIPCAGASNGSIDLTVSGGTAPYTYAWSNGSTTEDIANASAGAIDVIIADANGCTTTGNWNLTEPDTLNTSASMIVLPNGIGISCAGQADGAIGALSTGGTAPFTTMWSGPNGYTSNASSISGLFAGSYTLTTTDANGCATSNTVLVNEPTAITTLLSATTYNSGVNISCAGGTNGAIQSNVNGGVPGYTYAWTGPNAFSSSDAWINSLGAGSYLLLITDATGCESIASITLIEPQPLDVAITLSDFGGFQVGCMGNDGSIDLLITGGTPQYATGWSGPNGFGSMNEDINALVAGDYLLQVMDANGCEQNDTITLVAASTAQFTFDVTGTDCSGTPNGAIDVTVDAGEAPLSFAWTGPNGFSSTSEDLGELENGSYTATITDAAGCVSTHTATITGPAPLFAGAYVSFYGQYNLQCLGDSTGAIELDPQGGNGPFSVLVSGPGGYSSTALDHTALVAGDYQIDITDALGCTLDTLVTLTQPNISIDATLSVSLYPSGTNVSCFGSTDGSIDATINGGIGPFTFLWRGPDSTEFSTEDITGLAAGSYAYELVVTDANQCSFFADVILTQPNAPLTNSVDLTQFNGNNVSCAASSDGAIDVEVSGGSPAYQYNWSGPGGFSSNNADISGLLAGAYIFTVTDTNGCVLSTPVELVAPQPLIAVLDAAIFPGGSNSSCFGANDGAIEANITGGTLNYILAWSGPNGFASDLVQLNALAPGTYCLGITDANGCATQQCTTLTEPQVLAASASTQPANCGANIGAIDLNVTGGSAPFTYAWSNGNTSEDLNSLAPDSYNVVVTDLNGCTTATIAIVNGTPGVEADAIVTDNLCNGGNAGAIDLTMISGAAPYNYAWNDGSTDEDRNALLAGQYSVQVTDANGCTWTDDWTVSESSAINIDSTLSVYNGGYNVSSTGGSNGSISIAVSGGAPPYTIAWSNGSNSTNLYNLSAGSYTVTITDANGCVTVRTIILTEPQDLDLPTGYTPNGDGSNDYFVVHGLDAYPNNQFTVLNRWGNTVYDRLNYTNDWQGENTQGEQLPNGTYFVILTINKGERTLQGYVDLRR